MNLKQNVYLLFATINIEQFSSSLLFSISVSIVLYAFVLLFCCYPSSDVSKKERKTKTKKKRNPIEKQNLENRKWFSIKHFPYVREVFIIIIPCSYIFCSLLVRSQLKWMHRMSLLLVAYVLYVPLFSSLCLCLCLWPMSLLFF